MRVLSASIFALALSLLGGAASAAEKAPAFTLTKEQAARGRAVFEAHCSSCHGALSGGPSGPPLKGATFRLRWDSQSIEALHAFNRTKMPPNDPGGLPASEYVDLLAYILEGNGAVAGKTPVPSEASARAAVILSTVLPPPDVPPLNLEYERSRTIAKLTDPVAEAAQKASADRMAKLPAITDDMLSNPPRGAWLNWRGTQDAHGFSPLDQITKKNVGQLRTAWSWSLATGPNEVTPLVHAGIMFVASGNRVQALDAATGDLMWQYVGTGSGILRNIAIYKDRIILPEGGNIIALDMRTGVKIWDRAFRTPKDNIRFTSGPIIAKGKAIVGSNCGWEYPGGCYIVALDADTGAESWRFYTIARPGQPGGDSWNGAPLEKRFGGAAWMPGSYDSALDLVFMGTSQTYVITTLLDNATGAPGANDGLYTDTTLALRPATGELVWYYQHTNRDVWDLDWVFERTLATLDVKGKKRRTVTTAGKMTIFDTLDAATGEYLFSHDLGIQNVVASIDPKTGAKKISAEAEPKPNVRQLICPSTLGGRDWPATAFNPNTGIIYVPILESCFPYIYRPGDAAGGFLGSPVPRPDSDGKVGRLVAFDLVTGKTVWMQRRRAAEISAVLATAGGIVFHGSTDRWFRAADDRTGKVLWETRLDHMPASFPITYEVDGVQYVAVTAGGGSPQDGGATRLTAEIVNPAAGTTLWVFRLPKKE